jgi:hypothetical protein
MLHSIKTVGLGFIALGVAYLVYVSASKEKGVLKSLGYVLAVILIAEIIILSAKALLVTGCTVTKGTVTCGYTAGLRR